MGGNAGMSDYRQIITKAVVGKGRKYTQCTHTINPTHRPTSILGCWVINSCFDADMMEKKVEVCGTYDISVWYSYADNTKTEVVTETVNFRDLIQLKFRDEQTVSNDYEVSAQVLQQPNCVEANISPSGKFVVQVAREFLAEIIGETKLWVMVADNVHEEIEDCELDDEEFENLDVNFFSDSVEE